MKVLVTGGAGYIGSVTTLELIKQGYDVVVFDDLSYGHRQTIPEQAKFIKGDLLDRPSIYSALSREKIEAVVHFAGFIAVGESVKEPLKYVRNNVIGGFNLIDSMRELAINKIIFSSSAAVYGNPKRTPIQEDDDKYPANPYGETKLIFEKFLEWCDLAYGIRSVSLRYFNAAGADIEGGLGEDHDPETHLIPLILEAALGQREKIEIYGTDYDTKDGTCIRDYVHVKDLASAHVLALKNLQKNGGASHYNLGSSHGYSVREVIEMCREITGKRINASESPRRAGDPASLVASSDKIKKELGFKFNHSDLRNIIETAWQWHSKHPDGYK
ncbi:MAG: UDP-glucose 4-epimerase GalE [bacterium]